MKGVINACVSAGSNQVGASETWIAHVNCPLGPAGKLAPGTGGASPAAAIVSRSRRVRSMMLTVGSGASPLRDELVMRILPIGSFLLEFLTKDRRRQFR